MAATDPRPSDRQRAGFAGTAQSAADEPHHARRRAAPAMRRLRCLSPDELTERLDEEIGRATRHRTPLCCLLLRLDELDQITEAYGAELSERALSHVGEALCAELRRFDRVGRPQEDELAVVLPGAAVSEGEAVARRALQRIRAIKIEAGEARRPLSVSVGIAAWRKPATAEDLVAQARRAALLTRAPAEDSDR
jgi:diguanylate cyclase (GGDEF)-like protein